MTQTAASAACKIARTTGKAIALPAKSCRKCSEGLMLQPCFAFAFCCCSSSASAGRSRWVPAKQQPGRRQQVKPHELAREHRRCHMLPRRPQRRAARPCNALAEISEASVWGHDPGKQHPKLVFQQTEGKGGSAQTFKGLLAYVWPMLFIYENVDSIDDKVSASAETNCDILLKSMAALGYAGQKLMTDAQEFGLPCRRRRLYILFIREASPKLCFQRRSLSQVSASSSAFWPPACAPRPVFLRRCCPKTQPRTLAWTRACRSRWLPFWPSGRSAQRAQLRASLRTLGTGLSSTPSWLRVRERRSGQRGNSPCLGPCETFQQAQLQISRLPS